MTELDEPCTEVSVGDRVEAIGYGREGFVTDIMNDYDGRNAYVRWDDSGEIRVLLARYLRPIPFKGDTVERFLNSR